MEDVEEELELNDGTRVRIRPVTPEDKHHFVEAIEHASPRLRRMRFFQTKERFTEAELAYLTEVDGYDHVAIGALHAAPDGHEVAVGVGRYVRDRERPERAEVAVAVRDAYQHRGLGRALLARLMTAARAAGVRRLEMHVLPENLAAQRMLRPLTPDPGVRQADGALLYEIDLT